MNPNGQITATVLNGEVCDVSVLRSIEKVEHLVNSLVASWHNVPSCLQNRHWHRMEFRNPILVTQIDDHPCGPFGEHLVAVCRDISLGGISFEHAHPLPHRTVAVTFQLDDGGYQSVAARLSWCRFSRDGSYVSGGKFQRMIDMPIGQAMDWDQLPRA